MDSKKFYITTAIPYVNAAPHIGFALELVQTDAIARYQRQQGKEVHFLTGTDDNALKNVQAAEKHGEEVGSYVTRNSNRFREVLPKLNIANDDFIRTTEERHVKACQIFWEKCQKDIYKKKYSGLYCVGCETYYLEKDLVDGKCPEHKTVPEEVEEENYFFRLSAYQKWLEKLIESDEYKVVPEFRKNEVLAFIRGGLDDFSISRSVKRAKGWGIPVPNDPSQIIYVWFDALLNYITALGWPNGELFKKFWPANLHVIGKGVTRFHAIYWPAMLKSAGVETPKELFVHGYVTVGKEKISKTLGNVIDPFSEVDKYGVDAVRYYLLREIPGYGDGDYSTERFLEVYNSELANNLGNLVSRLAKLGQGLKVSSEKVEFAEQYKNYLDKYQFDLAIKYVFEKYVDATNVRLNEVKPWTLDPADEKRIECLKDCVTNIRKAAYHLQPFIPETSAKILAAFEGEIKPLDKPLFPRINQVAVDKKAEAGVVVGKIKVIEKLEDETIQGIVVEVETKEYRIICSDLSLKIGQLVGVALPGVEVNSPGGGKVKIKKAKVHGFESEGMLCSALELGLGQDHSKIHIFDSK